MTEIKPDNGTNTAGQIQIVDEVLAIIAGTAALETEGIVSATGNLTQNISELLGMKDFSKGVKIAVEGSDVVIEINVLVKYGYRIPEVTLEAQKKVKNAIETMTGLSVVAVNLNVAGLAFEKEKKEQSHAV